MFLIIMFAAFIIGSLLVVAGYYLLELKKQKKRHLALESEREQAALKRRQSAVKSIKVLANATLEDQLTYTETSIRVSVLVRSLPLTDEERAFHQGFIDLANETAHIPYLDKWKELDKKQKRDLTIEREKIEQRHKNIIRNTCELIVNDNSYFKHYLT